MAVDGLDRAEQVALVGLVRHLVLADGRVSDNELYELIRLGVAMGRADFDEALEVTEDTFGDRELSLAWAERIERPAARARIAAELERIAGGDGLHATEVDFLAAVRTRWA
ncbi:MAG: hypothetical protein H6737_28820 [Alphaproteobacteria bacterium]|nr:hypothetical protein [Alphaproteobacteria bacterium]